MQSVRIYFDEGDTDLVRAVDAMPKGERSAQVKMLLRFALAGTGGLLVRIAELERRLDALEKRHHGTPSAPPPQPTVDAQKATLGLLKKFGAFDDG